MTDTVLSSHKKEVVIGFERRFVMIGERINPTGRKLLAAEMAAGDYTRVVADALAQVEAGAQMLDVNAGIPLADEPAILAEAIKRVQEVTDVPLSIDSSIVAALESGLSVYKGKALVNSVTGEEERLESVLPLVKKYGAAVVAISNDETGISEDPDVRFEVAKKIVQRAADYGIPKEDVVVDPLVMPIGALGQAGNQAFALIRRLRSELKVNTTCGASNVSFGLPNRHAVTGTFLSMAIGAGMTSAIMSPLHAEVKTAIMAADVLSGNDQDCMNWIRANRDPNAPTGGRGNAAGAFGRGGGKNSKKRKSNREKRQEFDNLVAPVLGGIQVPLLHFEAVGPSTSSRYRYVLHGVLDGLPQTGTSTRSQHLGNCFNFSRSDVLGDFLAKLLPIHNPKHTRSPMFWQAYRK